MSGNSEETIPQIALFIQESSVRPPPPPPQVASNSAPRTAARVPRPMIVPTHHLPPPPPPPPPAVPSTSTSQLHNIVYRGQSVNQPSTSYAMCHPPTAIPMFDARRPPPPIPTYAQPNNSILKKPMSNSFTGNKPSKLRRTEEPKHDDALCDVCVQREIRIESYRKKMLKMSSEDECQTLLLQKKQNEYLRQKDFLRSLVDSDTFRKIEQFVEDVPQYNFQSVLNNLKYSCRTGVKPSIPNQVLLQFMDYFFSDSSKFESSQSERVEDSLRQTLSAMSRSPVRRSSPDFLQKLQEMLYNEERTSSSERHGYGEQSEEHAHSSGTNGVSSHRGYSNGQLPPPAHLRPSAPLPPPAPQPPSAPLPPPMSALPPPMSALPHLAPFAPFAPPPTTTYSHYPPPRHYYPPPYLPPSAPRATTSRAPVPPRAPNAEERYPSPYYYYHQ